MSSPESSKPPEDRPLAAFRRGDLIESFHRGRIAVCDSGGTVLEAAGDAGAYTFIRSSAKPFQALPLVLSGAAGALGLTDEEIAVACGSHGGEERHLGAVRSILRKAGLAEESLQSGAHQPLHPPSAARLIRDGEKPRPVHSNCSGKHAGMLALCAYQGWATEDYRDPEHPLQRRILEVIAEVCGLREDEIPLATDGCGVPTFALPLRSLATGFARLATGEGLSGEIVRAAARIRGAMRSHPYMVAGEGRFDTELMGTTGLLVKSGAEGVFACGSPEGWGMAVKVSDGAGRAVRPAVSYALASRSIKLSAELERTGLENLHGEVIGEVSCLL